MPLTEEEANHVASRLHRAVRMAAGGLVETMLENNADVNGICCGQTPLHTAAEGCFQYGIPSNTARSIVKLLIDFKADVNRKKNPGFDFERTPLHVAAECQPKGVVQMLIEAGSDVSSVDGDEYTPLLHAIMYQENDLGDGTVCQLLHAGADVNHADREGNTALHAAITGLQPTLVMLLLEYNANLHTVGERGMTQLELAEHQAQNWFENDPDKRDIASTIFGILQRAETTRRERALAFAMGLHERIGADSILYGCDLDVLQMILDYT
jgi:ankyrin repeat protein